MSTLALHESLDLPLGLGILLIGAGMWLVTHEGVTSHG